MQTSEINSHGLVVKDPPKDQQRPNRPQPTRDTQTTSSA